MTTSAGMAAVFIGTAFAACATKQSRRDQIIIGRSACTATRGRAGFTAGATTALIALVACLSMTSTPA